MLAIGIFSALLVLFLLYVVVSLSRKTSEKREKTLLTWAVWALNVFLILAGIAMFFGLIAVIVITVVGPDKLLNLLGRLDPATVSDFKVNYGDHYLWDIWSGYGNVIIAFLVTYNLRRFLKNIITDQIFVQSNVRLARFSSLFLFIGAFTASDSFFDVGYGMVALLVWVLSKILEKAIAIAEENEFTI